MLRAIYIGDARHDVAHIFEYNALTEKFEMIGNTDLNYPLEIVANDPDWIIVVVAKEEFYQLENKNRVSE